MLKRPRVAKEGCVYLMFDHVKNMVKIGFTTDIIGRHNAIRVANPGVELLYTFPATNQEEYDIQQQYVNQWVDGDWFILTSGQVRSIIENHKQRNNRFRPAPYHGHHLPKPDAARIRRVLAKYRPARSFRMAESENERLHFERLVKEYGQDYLTFRK